MRVAASSLLLTLALVPVAQAQLHAPRAPAAPAAPAAPPSPKAPARPRTFAVAATGGASAFRDLERTWKQLKASPTASDFARGASLVCTQAFGFPRDLGLSPGSRAGLIAQSCQGALSAAVAQQEVADPSVQTWQRGFVPSTERGALDCFALEQLAPVVDELVTKDPALMERYQEAHQRCGGQQHDAQRGRDALGLPLCERISALASLLEDQGPLDWAARHLAQADDAHQLASRWARLAGRQARFEHVVAYHLSEARIELATFAEHAARAPELANANEVREAFQCLGDFRGASVRLREFERRLGEQHGAWAPAPREGACCRHCSRGKACGDACIARELSCDKQPGCACDG